MDYNEVATTALRRPRPLSRQMQQSVMVQPSEPGWQPEYEQEPPLEQVSPEDWVPSPKSIVAALKGMGPALGALGVVRSYTPKALGPATKAKSFDPEDLNALRDLVGDYTKPRMLSPDRADALLGVLKDAELPGTKTNVLLSEFDEPLAAYARTPGAELGLPHEYLSNLVAIGGQPGTGRQALVDVAQQAPVSFIATPGSKGFYDKLIAKGFPGLKAQDGGIYELDAFAQALRNK